MPREYYQLGSLDIREINRVLESISRRLNYIVEYGNDTSLSGMKIIELAAGVSNADAIRKDQAFLLADLLAVLLGTTDEITVTDNGNETLTFSLPASIKLDGATATRLLATDASKKTVSVADLTAWIAGTTNQITSTSDGDGTITLSLPQDIHTGASPTFVTIKLSNLTDGYVPYHVADATGLANSILFTDGTNIGINTATPDVTLHIAKSNATAILRLERIDTTIGTDDIVARIEVEGQDTDDPGICAKIEAIGEGTLGETGWRFSTGTPTALPETMRLTSLGYLGLGVTEPDVQFHIENATGAVQRLTRNDTTATATDIIGRIEFETRDTDNAGVSAIIQAIAEGTLGETALAFSTGVGASATERFRIRNNGVFEHNQLMRQYTGSKTLTDGSATSFVDIVLASGEMVGGHIEYTIYVSDATPDYQVHSGILTFAAYNKGGVITTDIDEVYLAASETEIASAGTLSDAWTAIDGTGKVTLQCNANTSLAGATITLEYTLKMHSLNIIVAL